MSVFILNLCVISFLILITPPSYVSDMSVMHGNLNTVNGELLFMSFNKVCIYVKCI
jgi:hypothetical protein